MEFYWQVNPKTLHFNTNEKKEILARIQVEVSITNDTGRVIKEDQYIYQTRPCANVQELETMNILELKRYFLTPGVMKMSLKLTDLNDTANHYTAFDTFTVKPTPEGPFYGSTELIDTFYVSDVKSPFRKHGMQYIPMCEPFFDTYKGEIAYYNELYHLERVNKIEFPLIQSVYISKKQSQEPSGSLLKIDTINSADYKYVTGKFDISKLPSGNYYLNIMLGSKNHKAICSSSIFFQRLNKYKNTEEIKAQKVALDTGLEKVTFVDLGKTFLAKFTLIQVTGILKMLLPLTDVTATQTIEAFLKKPDDMYMRYFIYNYFTNIDVKKPEKAWKEYSEKVKEVNRMFSKGGKIGYETERGFMFLRYGAPSEIITAAHEKGALPYEIWQYNTLKDMTGKTVANAVMLFYKTTDSDFDYRLLHTNINGEIHNGGWRNFLFNVNDATGDNASSKAEQYIGNK
ncbi:MAG: GWxTD domain-containing protein [Taibaiella sp.]|nr:GWxTD domain-containing protein [Taibaiella sp.]